MGTNQCSVCLPLDRTTQKSHWVHSASLTLESAALSAALSEAQPSPAALALVLPQAPRQCLSRQETRPNSYFGNAAPTPLEWNSQDQIAPGRLGRVWNEPPRQGSKQVPDHSHQVHMAGEGGPVACRC